MREQTDLFIRAHSMEAVAGLKDQRTIEPIALHLLSPFDRGAASKALKIMGQMAESTVVKFLAHKDVQVRREVCVILGEIGTQGSVSALESAANETNPIVANAARSALEKLKEKAQ